VSTELELKLDQNTRRWDIITCLIAKKKYRSYFGFEILKALTMESSVFWIIRPSSPVKVNRLFRGTYRLHSHVRRVGQKRKQNEAGRDVFLFLLLFDPEDGGDIFFRYVG
jgi:hypothetical protein